MSASPSARERSETTPLVRREHRAPRVRLAAPADLLRQGGTGHELAECAGVESPRRTELVEAYAPIYTLDQTAPAAVLLLT